MHKKSAQIQRVNWKKSKRMPRNQVITLNLMWNHSKVKIVLKMTRLLSSFRLWDNQILVQSPELKKDNNNNSFSKSRKTKPSPQKTLNYTLLPKWLRTRCSVSWLVVQVNNWLISHNDQWWIKVNALAQSITASKSLNQTTIIALMVIKPSVLNLKRNATNVLWAPTLSHKIAKYRVLAISKLKLKKKRNLTAVVVAIKSKLLR